MAAEQAQFELEQLVAQSPTTHGLSASRWTLCSLLSKSFGWLNATSRACLSYWLTQWEIRYKRGRMHVHSPDPDYQAKLEYMGSMLAGFDPEKDVLLSADQLTVYLKPSVAQAYMPKGSQPLAKQGLQQNSTFRIAGAVNLLTGQVHYLTRNKISTAALRELFRSVCEDEYPNRRVFWIQDNWPVHYHPDVLEALEEQKCQQWLKTPKSWANAKVTEKAKALNLPVQILPLPTYASWLNPIEKLWRKLKQEILHLHHYADQKAKLKSAVDTWMGQFKEKSPDLLRYMGIQKQGSFYQKLILSIS